MNLRPRCFFLLGILIVSFFALALCRLDEFDDEDELDELDLTDVEDLNMRVLLAEHARESNATLQWGPYRPNLYLGIRPRGLPESFLAGLMWHNTDTYTGLRFTRHSCETGHDFKGYGWEAYDARSGGRQVLHDVENAVDIYTEFVKDGSNWALRVRGVPKEAEGSTSIIFYFGTQGLSTSRRTSQYSHTGYKGDVEYEGEISSLGRFRIAVTYGPETNDAAENTHPLSYMHPADAWHARTLAVNGDTIWRSMDYYMALMQEQIKEVQTAYPRETMPGPVPIFTLYDTPERDGNLHFLQRSFKGGFEFDILFEQDGEGEMTSEKLTSVLEQSIDDFDERYSKTFPAAEPFTDAEHVSMGKALVSNLMGGIGYFQGTSLVDKSDGAYDDEEEEEFWNYKGQSDVTEVPATELFCTVPSRPFFPRGFYWDEGFHLLPVLKWDPDLALEVIKSWFSLTDEDGWIAREQILGEEARSKVPKEFQTQFPSYANPPTMMLTLVEFIDDVEKFAYAERRGVPVGDNEQQQLINFPDSSPRLAYLHSPAMARAALKRLYPTLKRHYNWFRRTQAADIRSWHNPDDARPKSWTEGYRWRGRTPNHCLTSGLDDYPRAAMPHPAEMHVDLMAWMGSMTKAMIKISRFVGAPEADIKLYEKVLEGIEANLEDLHWSEEDGMYCDLTWDMEEDRRVPECHEGYVTLVPFMLGLVPADKIGRVLDRILDPEGVWSAFGIRSLSKREPAFGKDEDYWRGAIWVNMNYLVLRSAQDYYKDAQTSAGDREKLKEIYSQLRTNIVQTVYKQWEETGFAWEQYEQSEGKAKGVKHFTGWTSLTTMIMSMPAELGGK
ncbi:putative mannosyl-oligosaccharide glucosidase [Myxozyma melibiosi]|uniref:Mannosyl-oligosaccharide glucosidase n=1 Tax=Myxozyma melibiosi TaxID=54550 RepID=A0ABR1FA33_9ASCO